MTSETQHRPLTKREKTSALGDGAGDRRKEKHQPVQGEGVPATSTRAARQPLTQQTNPEFTYYIGGGNGVAM